MSEQNYNSQHIFVLLLAFPVTFYLTHKKILICHRPEQRWNILFKQRFMVGGWQKGGVGWVVSDRQVIASFSSHAKYIWFDARQCLLVLNICRWFLRKFDRFEHHIHWKIRFFENTKKICLTSHSNIGGYLKCRYLFDSLHCHKDSWWISHPQWLIRLQYSDRTVLALSCHCQSPGKTATKLSIIKTYMCPSWIRTHHLLCRIRGGCSTGLATKVVALGWIVVIAFDCVPKEIGTTIYNARPVISFSFFTQGGNDPKV